MTKSMKKTVVAFVCLSLLMLGKVSHAQDGANDKNFRFGLQFEPSFNFTSPDDKKVLQNDKMKFGISVGAVTDFKLGENIWLSTGVALDFNGANFSYVQFDEDSIGYVYYDDEIIEYDDKKPEQFSEDTAGISTQAQFMLLDSRSTSINYVNIPLMIKAKTKEIGAMTYYGKFGLLMGFKTKARSDDMVKELSSSSTATLEDVNIDSEMAFFRMSGGIGGGAEFNISGSTSAFFDVTFHYGFTNLLKSRSEHLIELSSSTASEFNNFEPQKLTPHAVRVSIGILF